MLRQLDGHDAQFLYGDTGHANANVTLISIYDPSTGPGGRIKFKQLLAHVESRMHRSPVFRQKLLKVPLDMDYPYWVDDDRFDLEYHVRHIALPEPGDWRQFCIQASRIHARPLDLSRPLWELYLVEGLDTFLELPRGSFAILTKIHHAAIDVNGGTEITTLLHDTTQVPPPPEPPEPWFPSAPPGSLSMVAGGVVHNLFAPFRTAGPLARAFRRVGPAVMGYISDLSAHPERLPVTRFNSEVSPYRVFEGRRFLLEEFKRIRALVPGSTVNDVVLAVCGGGMRRYLEYHGELHGESLTAMVPMTVRVEGVPEVKMVRVPLGTDIDNARSRLRFITRYTSNAEELSHAVGAKEMTDIENYAPAAMLAVTARMLSGLMTGAGRRAPLANCTITNVPGPAAPLYLNGARMTYFSAMMPISDGMGLVFAVTSYDGRVFVSPSSCREQMPDPEHFAQCIRDSFQELLALAPAKRKVAAKRKAPPKRAARRRRRAA